MICVHIGDRGDFGLKVYQEKQVNFGLKNANNSGLSTTNVIAINLSAWESIVHQGELLKLIKFENLNLIFFSESLGIIT